MPCQRPLLRPLFLLTLTGLLTGRAAGAATPVPLANPGFEEGEAGQLPAGWSISEADRKEGYAASIVTENPASGSRCLLFTTPTPPQGYGVGEVVRSIDATPLRGKRIRFRAATRVQPTPLGPRARLWIGFERTSRPAAGGEFLSEPIVQGSWKTHEVSAEVPPEATQVQLGIAVVGNAKAWIDSTVLEVVGAAGEGNEPARALSPKGLVNLRAFARLYGYVRYFHPSDEAAAADWNALALAGVHLIEEAQNPEALAMGLRVLFHPLAPTIRIYPTAGEKPTLDPAVQSPPEGALEVLSWSHSGVDLTGGAGGTAYSSRRASQRLKAPGVVPAEPIIADLGAGVSALVPLALYKDGQGTLPHRSSSESVPAPFKPEGFLPTGNDRTTRLAGVVIAWNVFQHFYPYFDVVKADWPAELDRALKAAAGDGDAAAFTNTLRRLVAALHDGHGNVAGPGESNDHRPPILWDWVEGRLVVTNVAVQGAEGVVPGDIVTRIDGKPAEEALAQEEALTSGATPQWIRFRALGSLLAGPTDRDLRLDLRHADGSLAQVTLRRSVRLDSPTSNVEPRPAKLTEILAGIYYLDVNRLTDDDVKWAMDRLAKARGLVVDFRGYPSNLSPILLAHLIDQPVSSAQWHIPKVTRPDRVGLEFDFSNWPVQPEAPRFRGKVAFLIYGGAISYAETYMGIVEHYKLGALVGEPTAGTNGNINPFSLPGGYRLVWTGMQVLKHDGSRHHGVGILPTVPVSRTIAGIAAGRDEVLEKGIEVVSQ